MKKIILMTVAAALAISSSMPATTNADPDKLIDSGINYTESTETIDNPGAGYTSSLWYVCKPGDTPVKNPRGDLVVLFIDIGAFSSGVNGFTDEVTGEYTEGTDYDLDESFFEGISGTLENCRRNGSTVGLRFRYDAVGKSNPEPADFEKVLGHIRQIDESGILREYEDILMYVESGFVGAWGEQHSGKYTSTEYKARLLDAMLDIVPESVSVTVRTPNTFCKWAGIKNEELEDYVSEPGTRAARVGLYNDGYMGSDSDLGTYGNPSRAAAVKWMKNQMRYAYFGGEFSGNIEFAQQYETYLPENSIPEMYDTHLTYINSNIWTLYKDMNFGPEEDIEGVDNSSYYGQSVYKFIRDHLGYRFVLRDSDLTEKTEQGGRVEVEISVENTGFASPVKAQRAEVILEQDGKYFITETDIDDRTWLSAEVSKEKLSVKLPGNINSGKWNVYLRLSAGSQDMRNASHRTVKFANNDIYNCSIGANLLGSVNVYETENESLKNDTSFYEEGADSVSYGILQSYIENIVTDGRIGPYEWTDDTIAASSEKSKMYISSDNKYLYVCADVPAVAKAPVYNLQVRGKDEKEYWIYYASNGFVYFNGENYNNVICRYNGGTVEWRVPFDETMKLYSGKELDKIRVFVQDSADGWKVIDDLKAEKYTIKKVPDEHVKGDVNSDGLFNSADILLMQKYLLGCISAPVGLENSDLNENLRADICDLCLMKSMLL